MLEAPNRRARRVEGYGKTPLVPSYHEDPMRLESYEIRESHRHCCDPQRPTGLRQRVFIFVFRSILQKEKALTASE